MIAGNHLQVIWSKGQVIFLLRAVEVYELDLTVGAVQSKIRDGVLAGLELLQLVGRVIESAV